MSFDDIPEDAEPTHPCPECGGNVFFRNTTQQWECLICDFVAAKENL